MGFLASLASILGIEVSELVSSSKRSALLWSAIALFAFVALAFLLFAAYLGLTLLIGPIWAAVAIGLTALAIALCIYLTKTIADGIAKRREAERRRSAETTALVTTAAASALPLLLKSPLMRKVGIPVGAALAALYLAYRSDSHDSGGTPPTG